MTATVAEAAERVVHHYTCTLPLVGKDRCPICSAIRDRQNIGTMTVLIDELAEALHRTPVRPSDGGES